VTKNVTRAPAASNAGRSPVQASTPESSDLPGGRGPLQPAVDRIEVVVADRVEAGRAVHGPGPVRVDLVEVIERLDLAAGERDQRAQE